MIRPPQNSLFLISICLLYEHTRDVIVRVIRILDNVHIRRDGRFKIAIQGVEGADCVATRLCTRAGCRKAGNLAIFGTGNIEAVVVGGLAAAELPFGDGPLVVIRGSGRCLRRCCERRSEEAR